MFLLLQILWPNVSLSAENWSKHTFSSLSQKELKFSQKTILYGSEMKTMVSRLMALHKSVFISLPALSSFHWVCVSESLFLC